MVLERQGAVAALLICCASALLSCFLHEPRQEMSCSFRGEIELLREMLGVLRLTPRGVKDEEHCQISQHSPEHDFFFFGLCLRQPCVRMLLQVVWPSLSIKHASIPSIFMHLLCVAVFRWVSGGLQQTFCHLFDGRKQCCRQHAIDGISSFRIGGLFHVTRQCFSRFLGRAFHPLLFRARFIPLGFVDVWSVFVPPFHLLRHCGLQVGLHVCVSNLSGFHAACIASHFLSLPLLATEHVHQLLSLRLFLRTRIVVRRFVLVVSVDLSTCTACSHHSQRTVRHVAHFQAPAIASIDGQGPGARLLRTPRRHVRLVVLVHARPRGSTSETTHVSDVSIGETQHARACGARRVVWIHHAHRRDVVVTIVLRLLLPLRHRRRRHRRRRWWK
mmetsp:Transcript_3546/g.22285  ORF Transcript_3546/g.22285 Transcript_3546/m.22285 type:complete len:387 (+) Transcript_3546:3280-4440(+)